MADYELYAAQMRPLCAEILGSLQSKYNKIATKHIPEFTPDKMDPLIPRQEEWSQIV